jgi:hypothetical protein
MRHRMEGMEWANLCDFFFSRGTWALTKAIHLFTGNFSRKIMHQGLGHHYS